MLRSEPLSLSACKAVQERVCAALGAYAELRGTPLPLRPESTDSLDDWLCCLREKIGEVGDVISTYTYRLGIEQSQYSLTTAIGFTQSIVNFALVFGTNKLSKKLGGYSLW